MLQLLCLIGSQYRRVDLRRLSARGSKSRGTRSELVVFDGRNAKALRAQLLLLVFALGAEPRYAVRFLLLLRLLLRFRFRLRRCVLRLRLRFGLRLGRRLLRLWLGLCVWLRIRQLVGLFHLRRRGFGGVLGLRLRLRLGLRLGLALFRSHGSPPPRETANSTALPTPGAL